MSQGRKLRCLKPRLQPTAARVATHAVERKRGRAGVEDRQRIRRRDKGLCQRCLHKDPPRYTIGTQVDHIIALHKGGADTDENKQLLCYDCHVEKTAEDLRG